MESLLTLPVVNKNRINILQVTDTHLFANVRETLLGVNTHRSYHAVLDAIIAEHYPVDLIVATGDLAQDHSQSAYQHFATGITRLPAPCVWLPGNHDAQSVMNTALIQAGMTPAKQVLLSDSWQIILLDSQAPGVPYGELSDGQLAWMEHCLNAHPQRHAMILLHHHPGPCGCAWLDQHRLRNAQRLAEILAPYPTVKALVCGHIHQEMDTDWFGLRLLASPSTCVQFKPHCSEFTLDTVSPGWRWFELHSQGIVDTRVHRLTANEFSPMLSQHGY